MIGRRLGSIQHQIKQQGVSKGAYAPLQKRKRPKSKGNLMLVQEINESTN
jgi:hypothetical protein